MKLEELNAAVADGSINEVIRVSELRQIKALGRIADDICARDGKSLVLLAGGSSAGKTTTAMRLCTQLRVNGRQALHLSTDDYFVGDARTPRTSDGKLDYEHVECVDIPRLVRDMAALVRGETIAERKFDFIQHAGYDSGKVLSLPKGGIIVLEGIHALNPRLTEGVDDAVKYRVYIDPKPDLDLMGGIGPESSDARLLRRLVRDNRFRKMSPKTTFEMWPNVLAGEEKWIKPFSGLADATFDSYLSYEVAALKFFAGGLLVRARQDLGDRRDIMLWINVLDAVTPIGPETIPGVSILRETIGGSQLDY